MGQTLQIESPDGSALEWPAFVVALAEYRLAPVVRMIDGLPAFPDEIPGEGWREVRVSAADGMITIHASPTGYRFTIWNDTASSFVNAWQTLVYVAAQQIGGSVVLGDARVSPEKFAQLHQLAKS